MIAIIDYDAGNIGSLRNAMQRLNVETILTREKSMLRAADKVIFPGVGHAESAMDSLRAAGLDSVIPSLTQPVLGICLGMQLLCTHSSEGDTECLGVFDSEVTKFSSNTEKIPHMGWNNIGTFRVLDSQESSLLSGVQSQDDVYYVHSYHASVGTHTVATADYISPFSSVMQRDNFYATQFHPEKSAGVGEMILKNFLAL